jgi:hypothetical protein
MAANKERLTIHFIELLVERASSHGQALSTWAKLTPAWRRIFSETIAAFLDEVGHCAIEEAQIDQRGEDEQIRTLCEHMTARQQLKTYRQLYALGCRMDGIDHAIEKLTKPRN